MSTKQRSLWMLKFVVSGGLIYLLSVNIDLREFINALVNTDLIFFSVAFAISALGILSRAWKWQILLHLQGTDMSLGRAHEIIYMSLFFNNFFFGSLGGDGFRILKTQRHCDNRSGAFSAILIDRFSGFISLALVVMVSAGGYLLFSSSFLTFDSALKVIAIGGLCLVLGIIILYVLENLESVYLLGRYPLLARVTRDFVSTIKVHRYYPRQVLLILLLAFAYHLINVLSMYLLALAAGVYLHWLDLIFVVPLVSFLIMVPVSINGIGVQESAFFFFFEEMGVESSSALLIALLPRIAMLLSSLIGAVLYIRDREQAGERAKHLKT